MKEFYHITIKDLFDLRAISKLPLKEAVPKIIKFKDRHGFTDKQVKNLVNISKNFNPKKIILD